MPTTRPRHVITETETVARALDDAERQWPEDRERRAKLLLHLIEEGHRALLRQADDRRRTRESAIAETSGVLTGAYEPGYLDRLREDWPE